MMLTKLQKTLYKRLLKPVLFLMDPEVMHDAFTNIGVFLGSNLLTRWITRRLYSYQSPSLEQEILGIQFKNPVGLAAGFDKNARLTSILPDVGFGFEEVGSITGRSCKGNPKPRLWRLPKSKGLVVYYGLLNDGCKAISKRLRRKTFRYPIGTSIAKTNDARTVTERQGIKDYANAFKAFADIGDFYVVNISCPNAFGGEPFSDPGKLDRLLTRLDKIKTKKPVFVKIAVDTSPTELNQIIAVCDKHRVHGFVIANLTKCYDRPEILKKEVQSIEQGGVSGMPTRQASNDLISHAYKMAGERYKIIGVGGIFTAEDAYEKIKNGASLVELITGMIFEGPQLIGDINKGLVRLLKADGYQNISEAIGANHR